MPNGYHPLMIYAVDIGSEQNDNLAWCCLPDAGRAFNSASLESLAECLCADLADGNPVALGFECPLVIDIGREAHELTKARLGEGNRPWSAGAGASALATGLAQCAWLFNYLARKQASVRPTFSWQELLSGQANLLIWEAFISNKRVPSTHLEDARQAALAFQQGIAGGKAPTSLISFMAPYSLVGAALLRAGLSADIGLLGQPCIVIRP